MEGGAGSRVLRKAAVIRGSPHPVDEPDSRKGQSDPAVGAQPGAHNPSGTVSGEKCGLRVADGLFCLHQTDFRGVRWSPGHRHTLGSASEFFPCSPVPVISCCLMPRLNLEKVLLPHLSYSTCFGSVSVIVVVCWWL